MSTRISRLDTACTDVAASRSAGAAPNAGKTNPVVLAFRRLRDRAMRARQRRAAIADLSRLDDRLLQDIGIRRERITELVDENLRRSADPDGKHGYPVASARSRQRE